MTEQHSLDFTRLHLCNYLYDHFLTPNITIVNHLETNRELIKEQQHVLSLGVAMIRETSTQCKNMLHFLFLISNKILKEAIIVFIVVIIKDDGHLMGIFTFSLFVAYV